MTKSDQMLPAVPSELLRKMADDATMLCSNCLKPDANGMYHEPHLCTASFVLIRFAIAAGGKAVGNMTTTNADVGRESAWLHIGSRCPHETRAFRIRKH